MATMERPRPSTAEEEESAAPAVSSTSSAADAKESTTTETEGAQPLPSDPEEAVEALEKRLEGLGGVSTPVVAEEQKPAAAAPAPAPTAAAAPAPAAAAKAPAGKNALLVSQVRLLIRARCPIGLSLRYAIQEASAVEKNGSEDHEKNMHAMKMFGRSYSDILCHDTVVRRPFFRLICI